MPTSQTFLAQIDGRDATAQELAALAFSGFAHFTAMQVRDGGIRGFDLHLERLRSASDTLFGRSLPDEQVRVLVRGALETSRADHSMTLTLFSRTGEFTPVGAAGDPAVLIRTAPPSDGPEGPLRLAVVEHVRPLAEIKQVGEATKTYFLRQAVRSGFDDAVFIDARGRLSEGTIWNLAFWDGEAVIWPVASMLQGVTMRILRRRLTQLGVPQREEPISLDRLRDVRGAAVLNSWSPGIAVHGIGGANLPEAPAFVALLHEAYALEPATRP